jgi:hypothetical protein
VVIARIDAPFSIAAPKTKCAGMPFGVPAHEGKT